MPILVNSEVVPREFIRVEESRLAKLADWQAIPDSLDKGMRLREAAEWYAIDRVLLRQAADKDTRPIDPAIVSAQVQRLIASQSCRVLFDDGPLSRRIEGELRLKRTMRDLMGPLPQPTEEQIAGVYKTHRPSFHLPETVHAAHIVKHIDETHTEAEAHAGIQAALAVLESGEPFAAVADRYSDCKGNGGDLGTFARGVMVEEFDNVVFAMKAGERSPIFRTPFGFHIAEVLARTPGGIPELREVKDTIRLVLIAAREEVAARHVAERLRAQAQIRRISTREAARLAAQQGTG